MPRTRSDLEREAKVEEILEVAERMVAAGGFQGLSVAAVAREVGVANSAVYWYFPSKDHLFVAVLRRMLHQVTEAKPPPGQGVLSQARWLVDRLEEHEPLRRGLRERAEVSADAAALHEEFERLLRGFVEHGLAGAGAVSPDDVSVAADTLLALADGLVAGGLSRPRRDAALRYVLDQIAGRSA